MASYSARSSTHRHDCWLLATGQACGLAAGRKHISVTDEASA